MSHPGDVLFFVSNLLGALSLHTESYARAHLEVGSIAV